MANLLKSRKFWMSVSDVFFSSLIYVITWLVNPELADKIVWLILAWQPIVGLVIAGITKEDTAAYAAGAHPTQLEK